MNKEYVINNDKVTVFDEKGNIKEISNSDNLDKILEQENIVEKIETEISKYEQLKSSVKTNESHLIEDLLNGGVVVVIPLIIGLFFKCIGVSMYTIVTSIGTLSAPLYLASLMGVMSILRIVINLYIDHKKNNENKKIIKGANQSIKYLKSILPLERAKLNTLKHEKNLISFNGKKQKVVEKSQRIKEIDNLQTVNYKLGKNFMKYYRNYLTGTLHFVLEKEGDLNNMDHYFDIIEEEGPRLVKNFRHTDMY